MYILCATCHHTPRDFVIEKHINLEKNFPSKKNRRASKDIKPKKPRGVMKNYLFSNHKKKPRGVMKYYFACKGFEKLVIIIFTVKKPLI